MVIFCVNEGRGFSFGDGFGDGRVTVLGVVLTEKGDGLEVVGVDFGFV